MPGGLLGVFHELSHSVLPIKVLAVSFVLQIRKLRAECAKTHEGLVGSTTKPKRF